MNRSEALKAWITEVRKVSADYAAGKHLTTSDIEALHDRIDTYEDALKGVKLSGTPLEVFKAAEDQLDIAGLDMFLEACPGLRVTNTELGDLSNAVETVVRRMMKFRGVEGVKYRRRRKT